MQQQHTHDTIPGQFVACSPSPVATAHCYAKTSCYVTTLTSLLSSVLDPEESAHHCKGIETVAQLLAHAHFLARASDDIPLSFLRAQAPAVEHMNPLLQPC